MKTKHNGETAGVSDPVPDRKRITATANAIITRSELAFDEAEGVALLDILIRYIARHPTSQIGSTTNHDFSKSEAVDFISSALDDENPELDVEAAEATAQPPSQQAVDAVFNTATSQLPQREPVVAMNASAPSKQPMPESVAIEGKFSETVGNQPSVSAEDQADISKADFSDWSLAGRHIDSTIKGVKCGASLNQYGDHSATTTCSLRVIADIERTMLRTDKESFSRDAGLDELDDDLADELADVEIENLAVVAETTTATAQLPVAVLDADFFGVQVWHNPRPVSGQSYWSIKIRTSRIPEIDDDDDNAFDPSAMDQFQLHFRSSPRNFRKMLTAALDANKIDSEFDSYLRATTYDMHANTQIALLSQPIHKKFVTIAKGKSTRETRFVDRVWATLRIDQATNTPIKLTIMHPDRQHVVITNFESTAGTLTKSGKQRKPTSAGWLAFHDPDNLYAEMKRERRAQEHHRTENMNLTFYSPASRLGRFVAGFVKPVTDVVEEHAFEIKNLKRLVEMLSNENGRQAAEIDEIRNEIAEMRRRTTTASAEPEPMPASAAATTGGLPSRQVQKVDQDPTKERMRRLIAERKAQLSLEEPRASIPDPVEQVVQKETEDVSGHPLGHLMSNPHARAMLEQIMGTPVLTESEAVMIRETSDLDPYDETYISPERALRDFLQADGDPYADALEAFQRAEREA